MKVIDNFKGSMIGNHKIEGTKIFIGIKKEPVTKGYLIEHNYNLHFNFGLINESIHEKQIDILINCKEGEELGNTLEWIWRSNNLDDGYEYKSISGKMGYPGKFRFKLLLNPHEEVYLANYLPMDVNKIMDSISEITEDIECCERTIGKSIEGRRIKTIEIGDIEEKPTMMFLTGYHPPEMDTKLIQWILHRFNEKKFIEERLKRYSYAFIPLVNPDGYANNMQGSNMSNINFHWKFFGNSQEECPESHHTWDYCRKIKPVFFMDFHMFTFQSFVDKRPYVIPPLCLPTKISRNLQLEVNEGLSTICSRDYSILRHFIIPEKILAPNLLATGLRNEFGTVTSPKFHLHWKEGEKKVKNDTYQVVDLIFNVFNKNGIKKEQEILKKPYGDIKTSFYRKSICKLMDFFNFNVMGKIHNS